MSIQTLELYDKDGVTLRETHLVEYNPFYEIAARVGCCKLFYPHYMHAYWTLLKGLRDQEFTLLELGVEKGRSLRLWEESFPKAKIYGLDHNPDCLYYSSNRSTVIIGKQNDEELLNFFLKEVNGTVDLVIDDCSHDSSDQEASLYYLWPYVRAGGWYVIEDLENKYDHEFIQPVIDSLERVAERHYYPHIIFLRRDT